MNKWYSLLILAGVLSLAACSTAETKPAPAIDPTDTVKVEQLKPEPKVVKHVKQAQVIGVVRELRQQGCLIKKVATTDGIQYSQMVVTCGDPQEIPLIVE